VSDTLSTSGAGADDVLGGEDGVRIVDEHHGRIVVGQFAPARPPGKRPDLMTSEPSPTDRRSRSAGVPRGAGGKLARSLAYVLIALGALAVIDAGVTLVWQEPITALYAMLRQDHLNGDLRAIERAAPTPREQRALASLPDERRRVAFLARRLERDSRSGSAIGRIVIPKIGASYVVVKGTGTEELKSGPGIYPETSFPGIIGTTAIAGHRTTYLAPFRHIDALRPGNHILLYMPYAHFTYTVIAQRVVSPGDVAAAVSRVAYTRLVLSACTPLFSAAQRLLVYAHLTRTVPVGAARVLPGHPAIEPIEAPSTRPVPRRDALPTVLESLQPHVVAPLV
jgi:sortase A